MMRASALAVVTMSSSPTYSKIKVKSFLSFHPSYALWLSHLSSRLPIQSPFLAKFQEMRLSLLPPALLLLISSQTLAKETTTSSVTLTTTTYIASTTITRTLNRQHVTQTNSISTSAGTETTSAQPKMSKSLEATVLNSTNLYRELYLAQPLKWNDTLANFAQDHAKQCVFEHSVRSSSSAYSLLPQEIEPRQPKIRAVH